MSWQSVVALGLLVFGAVAAAVFHADLIAATLAGAATGFAVNREPGGGRNDEGIAPIPPRA